MFRLLLILLLLIFAGCGQEGVVEAIPPQTGETSGAATTVVTQADDAPDDDAPAGDADVLAAVATQAKDGTWSFKVTVRHPDTGWEDYANGWDVVLPDGTVVKRQATDPFTRLLGHPHVDEQPFTRSQSRLVIPKDVKQVTVRAHDLKDGFGGKTLDVELPASSQ